MGVGVVGAGEGLNHTCYPRLRWEEGDCLDHTHCHQTLGESNKVSQVTSKQILALQLKFTALKFYYLLEEPVSYQLLVKGLG